MKELIVAVLLVGGGVAWTELREWFPWIAKRIIAQAVSALAIEDRERMREELTAELAAIPGKISPLVFASSIWWGFWRTAVIDRLNISASQCVVRTLDIALGSLIFIWVAPLITALMLTVLTTGVPAMLFQQCVGRNNQKFKLFRLCTFDPQTRDYSPVGLFMRRTRLDRLPELLNVVRGDMSLVGPPPCRNRSPNCPLMEMKPGLFWFQAGAIYERNRFELTTFKTVKTYFRLLYEGFITSFFRRHK